MPDQIFGRQIAGQPVSTVLGLEVLNDKASPCGDVDAITSAIVRTSLKGARVVAKMTTEAREEIRLESISTPDLARLGEVFSLGTQQAHGAWYLPAQASLHLGIANLPYHFRGSPRFASSISAVDVARTALKEAEALYFWSVLEPLFSILMKPFDLRGPHPSDSGSAAWDDVATSYDSLGVGPDILKSIRAGGGWSRLSSGERVRVKEQLIADLRDCVTFEVGRRFRVFATAPLVEKFYAKSKHGSPLLRQVLTAALQRPLAGFFGGDWLAFLRYLDEPPHPDEHVATALPAPRIYVEAADKAPVIAAEQGIPKSEVDRILAAFWSSDTPTSPVHQRVSTMRGFWGLIDEIHARQEPGMPSLWGLTEPGEFADLRRYAGEDGQSWYHPKAYARLLPSDLIATISHLWRGIMLQAYPAFVVSSPDPYALMLQTFGPALKLWIGVALTAWFVTEGPYSRTSLPGLAKYHASDIQALKDLGCSVDPSLFEELSAAERELGPPQPFEADAKKQRVTAAVSIQLSVSVGSRRSGFEILRNIITRHRRAWAKAYLDRYLRGQWEMALRAAALEHNRLIEVKGKPPTLKQFVKTAVGPTNYWCGGDVSLLYRSIGEKCPATVLDRRLLSEPPGAFALRVFTGLGGKPTRWQDLAATIVGQNREKQDAQWRMHQWRMHVAQASITYVQLREALGRSPTLKEFGNDTFGYLLQAGADVEASWREYGRVVESYLEARASP